MGDKRGAYKVLAERLERKRPLERHRHGWEDNVKMDLQDVGRGGMDWLDLAQDKNRCQSIVNAVMNLSSFTSFYNLFARFSLLILEVSRSHTTIRHSR